MKKTFIALFLLYSLSLIAECRGVKNIEFNVIGGISILSSYTHPFVLSQPGPHIFGIDDVELEALTSTTLIKITSSNVTLDLQGHTFSQKNASSSNKNVTGIHIADGLSNVTIKNGNINNITGTAIIVGQNCFNITLSNLTIAQARSGSIEVQSGTDVVFIDNCFAGKSLSSGKNNFGLSLTSNKNINVINSSFIDSRAPSGYNAFGIFGKNCIDCSINNSAFNDHSGDTATGIYLDNCIAFEIDNVETNSNRSNVGPSSGIELFGGQGNIIKNGIAFYNKAATNAHGIYLHSGANYNQISNYTTSYQKASTTENGIGVCIITGTSNSLTNITAFGNTGGSLETSKGCGICLNKAYGVIIDNSTCNYNNGGAGKAYGIQLINSSKCIIEDNKLYYNHGPKGSWGIQESKNSFSFLASNLAFGNDTNYGVTHTTFNSIQDINFKSARSALKSNRGNVNVTT